jgi:hypothetical protein
VTNMRHTRLPSATRNRDSARSMWCRFPGSVPTVVHAATRAVKPDGNWHYRTSARANGWSWRTLHNSRGAGSKNPWSFLPGDSPRRCWAGRDRRTGARESALGNAATELDGGPSLAHSPGNGGWRSVAASGERLHGRQNCSSGRTGAGPGRSAHSPSKDKHDAQNAKKRLATIAAVDNAEMGPKGVAAPCWSSLVAKRQLRSEAFLILAAPPLCGRPNPPG